MTKRSTKKQKAKNAAASEFGRMGGLIGGKVRAAMQSAEERKALTSLAGKASAAALTPKQRSERARKAVLAYWAKRRAKEKASGAETN